MQKTINGFKRNLKWSQIPANFSLHAEVDILCRSSIYAESNEVAN